MKKRARRADASVAEATAQFAEVAIEEFKRRTRPDAG